MNSLDMNQIAPSFFPTSSEIVGGVRWLKDHPLVATAAATAVSVVAYIASKDSSNTLNRIVSWTDIKQETKEDGVEANVKQFDPVDSPPCSQDVTEVGSSVHSFSDYSDCSPRAPRTRHSKTTRPFSRSISKGSFARNVVEERTEYKVTRIRALSKQMDYIGDDCDGTASPQWGWYVSTTPPEEFYESSKVTVGPTQSY